MNSPGTPPREFTASDRVPGARRPLPGGASTLTGEVRRLHGFYSTGFCYSTGFDMTGVDYDQPAETAIPWPNSAP